MEFGNIFRREKSILMVLMDVLTIGIILVKIGMCVLRQVGGGGLLV